MPLEIVGEPVHTRCLSVLLRQGEGESIEFQADILDLRKAGLMALAGRIATAGIIHKMELRGSFEASTGSIEKIDWTQSHVMHEANRATRGECCRDPMDRLKGLIGTRLGAGFAADLKSCFGGPLGCTHVNTLFQEISAFVARLADLRRREPDMARHDPGERIASRSVFFDAFLPDPSLADPTEGTSRTTLSVRLADIHFGALDEAGRETLFLHDEVRLLAGVDIAGWQLNEAEGRERSRRGPVCGDAPWQSRDEALVEFPGRSLGGGMTRFCLDQFADQPEDALLQSALLALAPGMTQVGVVLSDTLTPSTSAAAGGISALAGPGPCYMLRAEGPLVKAIATGGIPDDSTGDSA